MRGYALEPVEEKSSPSHIVAIKRSSVWLHWHYIYIGNGNHGHTWYLYNEQEIGFQVSMQSPFHTLARRFGQNYPITLESRVTAPFNGRVKMISSNSTLVIHDLQYNDSTYLFSSSVQIYVAQYPYTSRHSIISTLKPIVRITVNGT